MFDKKSMKKGLENVDIATLNIVCDWVCKHCKTKNTKRKLIMGCRGCNRV